MCKLAYTISEMLPYLTTVRCYYIYLNISGNSFSSSSLLPSVAKQYGPFLKDVITCSLLNGASASFTIAVAFVLKVKNKRYLFYSHYWLVKS